MAREVKRFLDLPCGTLLRVQLQEGAMVDATFWGIDGMYSKCSIDSTDALFHLKAWCDLAEVDGRWMLLEHIVEYEGKKV